MAAVRTPLLYCSGWILVLVGFCQGVGLSYDKPGSCPDSAFFSSVQLECAACPPNQSHVENGLSCGCGLGMYKVAGSGISVFNCDSCQENQVVSRDGLFCLECGSGTTFDSSSMQCTPCSSLTEIYEDTPPISQNFVGTRSCVECPQGTWSSSNRFSCVECGIADCTQCVATQDVCFPPDAQPIPDQATAMYAFYADNFRGAVQQCSVMLNSTACQLVGHLCVLQNYLRADPACQQVLQLFSLGLLQPLFYPERGARTVLEETEVRAMLFTKNMSSLPMVVASYSLDGTLLALENWSSQQVLLCKDLPSRGAAAVRVGVEYHISCSVSTSDLTRLGKSPVFYELFFLNRESSGSSNVVLLPVPVLITNYLTPQGERVNADDNRGRWQLVRRFLLVEGVTTRPQYIRDMRLVLGLSAGGKWSVPYLRMTYGSWIPGSTSGTNVRASYHTGYEDSSDSLVIGLSVTTGLLLLLSVVYAVVKTTGYIRRFGVVYCDIGAYMYMIMEFCSMASSLLFLLLMVTSLIWLVIFKGQTVLFFVLPNGQQEIIFEVFLGVALFLRVIQVTYLMWSQSTVDIFIMDWERSRGVLVNRNLTSVPKGTQPDSVPTPVSIWRTYFVANEWNEIQSSRTFNHQLLLIIVLLFLEVVGLGNLARRDPEAHVTASSEQYSAPFSDILRFCISSLTFIIVAMIMRGYLFVFYERYVEHKIRQFIDLCSVSNVSVLILTSKLFGYYIHGRSVHGHADTNMREMNYNLHKEEEGLCGERGLESGSDLQAYELSLTTQFRTQYDTIYSPLKARWTDGGAAPSADAGAGGTSVHKGRGANSSGGLSEKTIMAYETMNQFLTQFFERSLQQMTFVVKDKLLAERVLKMEFSSPGANEPSIVYRDSSMNFKRVLFRGYSWTLFQLDVLVFTVVDLIARNYILAAVIAFIVTWSLDYLRDAFGRRNLARKTLVDDRFLI